MNKQTILRFSIDQRQYLTYYYEELNLYLQIGGSGFDHYFFYINDINLSKDSIIDLL